MQRNAKIQNEMDIRGILGLFNPLPTIYLSYLGHRHKPQRVFDLIQIDPLRVRWKGGMHLVMLFESFVRAHRLVGSSFGDAFTR